ARHARRPRAACGRGRRAHPGDDRRSLDRGPRLSRARRRAGTSRLAHERTRAQHAALARDREAAVVSDFRDDGAAALEWAASYLERVRDLPVLSQGEPRAIRGALPVRAPDAAAAL